MARKRDPKDPLAALAKLPGGPTTRRDAKGRAVAGTRLRKLVCSDACGYPPLRASRAAIDRGLPVCVCGAVFWPWDLDDVERAREAGHLSAEQYAAHPLVREYERQASSVAHGQAGPGSAICATSDHYNDPSAVAAYRVAVAVREDARSNQLAAARLAQVDEPMPF